MLVIFFTIHQQLSVYHIVGDVLVHLARKDKHTEQRGAFITGKLSSFF